MGYIMLLLAVLLGSSVSLLMALEYTAEFFSEGDHNDMGTGLLTCSIHSQRRLVAADVRRLDILHGDEVVADSEGTVAAPRYSLAVEETGRENEYTVHLRIEALSRADSGMYTCRAYGDRDGVEIIISETLLQVDVNYLPESFYPRCSLLGSRRSGESIQPGDSVTLLCSSKSGTPAVQLEWQEESGIEFTVLLQTRTEQYVQTEVTLDAIYTKDGLEFTCISRSKAFPDYRGSCTIGPLNIAPPSDEGTTIGMSTDAQQTTLPNEKIDRGTTLGGSEVSTSLATPSSTVQSNSLLGDDPALLIVIVVLSTILCISIVFNIYCAARSRRRGKTAPVTTAKNQTADSNYQGLNKSPVSHDPYTPLNTPEISLKTVTTKSTIVNYTVATAGEEDYAQVDIPQSPRYVLQDSVEGQTDSAYINLNIPSRSKLR